jgi:BirA family biotin operon repressor/biotin-[acetyl-CoA-carboxylase] ligase
MQLDPSAVDAGVRLVALGTVESTNKEAMLRGRRGERPPLWITAAAQTGGRGRNGRLWFSPPGNLYASLLLSNPSTFDRAPELAFVAALALRDAIVATAPALAPQLTFKWPNDLLLAGKKCAGILIEGEVGQPMGTIVVIGIGVNCAHHPQAAIGKEPVLFPATDLRAHGVEVASQTLFGSLSATMCRRIAAWDRGCGFPIILHDWLSAASGVGEKISVRHGSSDKTGRFIGLDQNGRLVLEQANGHIERIAAGDVFPFKHAGARTVPDERAT